MSDHWKVVPSENHYNKPVYDLLKQQRYRLEGVPSTAWCRLLLKGEEKRAAKANVFNLRPAKRGRTGFFGILLQKITKRAPVGHSCGNGGEDQRLYGGGKGDYEGPWVDGERCKTIKGGIIAHVDAATQRSKDRPGPSEVQEGNG